jgi:hypothetical protein
MTDGMLLRMFDLLSILLGGSCGARKLLPADRTRYEGRAGSTDGHPFGEFAPLKKHDPLREATMAIDPPSNI